MVIHTYTCTHSVSWAGVTVVERTLALMQEALAVDPEWEYFVNIGQVRVHICMYYILYIIYKCVCIYMHTHSNRVHPVYGFWACTPLNRAHTLHKI